jgi:hypothetical protein
MKSKQQIARMTGWRAPRNLNTGWQQSERRAGVSVECSDQLFDGEVRLQGGATTQTMIFLSFPSNLVPERKLGNQTLLLKNKHGEIGSAWCTNKV